MTMKRICISRSGIRRERPRPEDLSADPRDPDVVRAKALARAELTGSSQKNRARGTCPPIRRCTVKRKTASFPHPRTFAGNRPTLIFVHIKSLACEDGLVGGPVRVEPK